MKAIHTSNGTGVQEKSQQAKIRICCQALVLLFSFGLAPAQKFWLTTRDFPGGYKTGIALLQDSTLFVSTQQYVMRSLDEGNTFDTTLRAESLSTVFASRSGTVFAGGRGKVYFSKDLGESWDTVAVSTTAHVTGFVENAKGGHDLPVQLNMAVSPGVYFIRATKGNEVAVQKVLVF